MNSDSTKQVVLMSLWYFQVDRFTMLKYKNRRKRLKSAWAWASAISSEVRDYQDLRNCKQNH